MKLLITGASGPFGITTTRGIIEKGIAPKDLVLVTRNPEKLAEFTDQGATVKYGDFDDYDSLLLAFKGVDKMLMISTNRVGQREPQHTNAVNAAKEVGVNHIVYTSFTGKPDNTSMAVKDHRFTENLIKQSGMKWTFLRNSQYVNAMLDAAAPQAISSGHWISSSKGGRIAMITRDDCISSAIAVMSSAGHENTEYNITGPELISFKEVCELVVEISGHTIQFDDVDDEGLYAIFDSIGVPRSAKDDNLVDGFGWCSDDMVSFERSLREGDFAVISNDVEKLTGHKPTSVRDYLSKYQDQLKSIIPSK